MTITWAATGSSLLSTAWTPISRGRMRKVRAKMHRRKSLRSTLRRLAKGVHPKTYVTKPWKISRAIRGGFKINLGGRTLEVLSTPGSHLRTRFHCSTAPTACSSPATRTIPLPSGSFAGNRSRCLRCFRKATRALAPELKLVLGAHNIPRRAPDVLPKLVDAILAVRSGQDVVKPAGEGKAIHSLEDSLSFLPLPARSKISCARPPFMSFWNYKIAGVAFLIFLGCAPGASFSQSKRDTSPSGN